MGWEWVARIGGYVAAPFTGGMSIPVGESIAQGISQSKASNKANDQLQAANQQAMGVMGQAFSPYLSLGSQAAGTLGGLMGFSGGSAMPTGAGTPPPATPPPTTRQRPEDAPVTGHAQARPGTLAQVAAREQTASSFGGGAVPMRTPTGAVVMVPQAQVSEAQQRGGQVL